MNSSSSAAEEIRTLTFNDLPLAPFLKETVRSIGYETPTPIQSEAIPLVIEGRDLIGLAQTGTGKTAAFVLPILQRLSGNKEKGAKVLVLAPTRELAEQINDVIKELAPRTGVKSVTIYGGVSHGRQISDLRGRPQIVVACPGRLLDHMSARTIDLSGVEVLVLDEADRMCDMGFLPDIKKIIGKLPADRQTLLFSATMPPEIQQLTQGIQNDPAIVRVKMESPVESVSHAMYGVQQKSKPALLHHWLGENKDALVVVFTKMKHTAKRLAEQLSKKGEYVTSLHGNLSQAKRQHSLNGFKDGKYRVLIATDIAARGIDVKGITHVVNYDMPENLDAYIHRTGRAGRASATGEAVSFVTRGDAGLVRTIERWLKTSLERRETPRIDGIDEDASEVVAQQDAPTRRSPRGRSNERSRGRDGRNKPSWSGSRERRERPSQGSERRTESTHSNEDRRTGDRPPRSGGYQKRRGDDSRYNRQPTAGQRSGRRSDAPGYAAEGRSGSRGEAPQRASGGGRGNSRFSENSRGRYSGDRVRSDRGGDSRRGNRPNRGQPRDLFAAVEERDLSQVEAMKVIERRTRETNGERKPNWRGPRGGAARPQRRQRPQHSGRSWDR